MPQQITEPDRPRSTKQTVHWIWGRGHYGPVYLSPALDAMVSVYRRAALHDSELTLERSERSKMTAWLHRTRPMSEETRRRRT